MYHVLVYVGESFYVFPRSAASNVGRLHLVASWFYFKVENVFADALAVVVAVSQTLILLLRFENAFFFGVALMYCSAVDDAYTYKRVSSGVGGQDRRFVAHGQAGGCRGGAACRHQPRGGCLGQGVFSLVGTGLS